MNGFYGTMTVQNPYIDDASQPIRFWANKYKTEFNRPCMKAAAPCAPVAFL